MSTCLLDLRPVHLPKAVVVPPLPPSVSEVLVVSNVECRCGLAGSHVLVEGEGLGLVTGSRDYLHVNFEQVLGQEDNYSHIVRVCAVCPVLLLESLNIGHLASKDVAEPDEIIHGWVFSASKGRVELQAVGDLHPEVIRTVDSLGADAVVEAEVVGGGVPAVSRARDFTELLQVQLAVLDVKQQGIFQHRDWNNLDHLLLPRECFELFSLK